jgi:hypothetical protein
LVCVFVFVLISMEASIQSLQGEPEG